MHEDRLITVYAEAGLLSIVRRLAFCWLVNHSSNYTPMDGPRSKWDRLLKRVYVPTSSQKPVQPDKFYAPMSGGNETPWLLFGQLIGPYYYDVDIDDAEEYWWLWAQGLLLSDHIRAVTGRHSLHLPRLWTLEAPPPHFFM